VLIVIGAVLNSEAPPAVWVAAVWIGLVVAFNVWSGAARSRKRCPQCSEAVLAEARVCRYCGFAFPGAESPT
jgi:Uncharacterised protein family UPF0547